jgi:biotin carboxyl carrier protein
MHFEIEVAGRPYAVTVERTGTRYRVEADGRVDIVDVARVDASTVSLLVLGEHETSHEVSLVPGREPGDLEVYLRAGVVRARVSGAPGQKRWSAKGSPAVGGAGPQRVTAPMPGKVVRVLVKPGDEVKVRQGIVVVEAMKMENELRAARDGRVTQVHVTEGTLVESGRLLAVIEEA